MPSHAWWRHLGAQRFFIGLPLYYMAENMWTIVLLWRVLKLTHSPVWMAWGVAAQTIPMVVVGIWGAHRGGGKTLSYLVGAQVLAMGSGAWLAPGQAIGLIVLAALNGWLYARVIPSAQAYLMRTTSDPHLSRASARYELGSRVGVLLGPVVGGASLVVLPVGWILTVIAVLWAAVWWTWRGIPQDLVTRAPGAQEKTTWSGFHQAVTVVARDRFLGTALVIRGMNNLLWPAFTLAIPLLSLEVWHAGAGGFGVLRSVWGLSTILGTLVVVPLFVNRLQSVYFLSWLVSGIGFFAIAVSPLYAWALAASVIGALGSPLVHVALDTHIGRHIDKDLQGRLFALQQFIMSVLNVMGLGLVSWGLEVTTPGTLLATAGIIMMMAALFGLFWWWRVRPPAATSYGQASVIDAGELDG